MESLSHFIQGVLMFPQRYVRLGTRASLNADNGARHCLGEFG